MSEPVLVQLREAESSLADQESDLVAQLSAIQEQRKGLQTVISMFQSPESSSGGNGSGVTDEQALTTAANGATKATSADGAIATSKASSTAGSTGRKSRQRTIKATTGRRSRKSRGGKSPNWQRHIQEPFRKTPLPDVVANILKAEPGDTFKIADVMEIIFKEDIPKSTFLKARNRVSNILSAGARSKEWHRGSGGRYSMTAAAVN